MKTCKNCGRDKLVHSEWAFDKAICEKFEGEKLPFASVYESGEFHEKKQGCGKNYGKPISCGERGYLCPECQDHSLHNKIKQPHADLAGGQLSEDKEPDNSFAKREPGSFNLSDERNEVYILMRRRKISIRDADFIFKLIKKQDKEFIRRFKGPIKAELKFIEERKIKTAETIKMLLNQILKQIDKLSGDKLV